MIKPLRDLVLLSPILEEEKTQGGIFIPETAEKEAPRKFKVIEVGSEVLNLVVNDEVYVSKYNGTDIKCEGKDYRLVEEKFILSKLED